MINRCEITIEFDRPDRRYKTGEEVSGFVTVEVNKDCNCRSLQVDCLWQTKGRGDKNTGSVITEILFEGEWTAGGVHRYPFSFDIPNGPCTYHGQLLNVDWYVMARADIPWSIDPREEADFLVEVGGDTAYEPYLPGDPADHTHVSLQGRVQAAKSVHKGQITSGFIFIFVGFLGFLALALEDDGIAMGLAIWLVFALIGAASILMGQRNRVARKKLGEIQIQIPQKRLRAGEFVEVHLEIPPCSKARLNKVTAILTANEIAISDSGEGRQSKTHRVFGGLPHTFEGSVDRRLKKGESAHFSHRFQLPHDGPPSFHSKDNALDWAVEFHVDIAWWPDWKQQLPLEVLPAARRALHDDSLVEEDAPLEAEDLAEELIEDPLW